MSEKALKPCRVDEVSGWCKEHDAKGRLQEILYCDKGPNPYTTRPNPPDLREAALREAAYRAHRAEFKHMADCPKCHAAVMTLCPEWERLATEVCGKADYAYDKALAALQPQEQKEPR